MTPTATRTSEPSTGREGGWTDNVIRYDGTTSRVSTLESGGLTYYDWDGINVIQEKDAAGGVTDRQVHGYAPIPSVGDIALMDKGGTPYVPVSDQPGTVWNLLDGAAAKANSYGYDAFGVGRSASETVPNAYRFGTKRMGEDSNLYHFITRLHAPPQGRFVSRDALGRTLRGGYYTYVDANPTAHPDPLGLQAVPPTPDELIDMQTGWSHEPRPLVDTAYKRWYFGESEAMRCCSEWQTLHEQMGMDVWDCAALLFEWRYRWRERWWDFGPLDMLVFFISTLGLKIPAAAWAAWSIDAAFWYGRIEEFRFLSAQAYLECAEEHCTESEPAAVYKRSWPSSLFHRSDRYCECPPG